MLTEGGAQEHSYCGITVGIVSDIQDPDKKNRVKVRLLNRSDSMQETDYIRVMTPMAGKEYGAFFLPEVGDEVLVGFVDGDYADPYVLGCLWNPKAPAPVTVQEGKNEVRTIKSKTAHRLEFNDGTDAPGLILSTAEESRLAIQDKDKTITLTDKGAENYLKLDLNGGTVTLEAKKKLVLKCGGATIELDGSGNGITIKGSGNIKIDGQQVEVSGKGAVNVKASGQLNLEATGPANLKGAMVKVN